MIEFILEAAHPAPFSGDDRGAGTAALRCRRYRRTAPLPEGLRLRDKRQDDRSLGNADAANVIRLNAYWFGQEPAVLKRAAMAYPRFHWRDDR